jgi:protein translocase SecG subunit
MTYLLHGIQLVSAILVVVLVLVQSPQTDIGGFGSEGASFIHTRRGTEKLIFVLTIIAATLFALSSLAYIILIR